MAQRSRLGVSWLDRLTILAAICPALAVACDMRIDLGDKPGEGTVDEPDDETEEPTDGGQVDVYKPNPDRGLNITLVWTTPNGLDISDPAVIDSEMAVGADLDLHFVHPAAKLRTSGVDADEDGEIDGWFDQFFDTCFIGQLQRWGSPSTLIDDPFLDRDDTNGMGPENLHLEQPEKDACYKVGVHVWNDWGYGSSYATVNITWDRIPVYTSPAERLYPHDLWEVAEVCATETAIVVKPSGCTEDSFCTPNIMPKYPVPSWYQR